MLPVLSFTCIHPQQAPASTPLAIPGKRVGQPQLGDGAASDHEGKLIGQHYRTYANYTRGLVLHIRAAAVMVRGEKSLANAFVFKLNKHYISVYTCKGEKSLSNAFVYIA